jgi:hypothetical protein
MRWLARLLAGVLHCPEIQTGTDAAGSAAVRLGVSSERLPVGFHALAEHCFRVLACTAENERAEVFVPIAFGCFGLGFGPGAHLHDHLRIQNPCTYPAKVSLRNPYEDQRATRFWAN